MAGFKYTLGEMTVMPTVAYLHPQKWSTDLPGYRIGIPIDKAHRK